MSWMSSRPSVLALCSALAAVAAVPAAQAQANDDFLKGKVFTVVAPSGAGGSYHIYCEVVVRHIKKHLPGEPTTIVQNRPGGGGATAAAYMAAVAPKDGTVIAMIAPGSITEPLVRPLKYDATKFGWLGSVASRAQTVAVWHEAPVKTIEDLKTTEITMAATGRADAGYVVPALVNAVLGTKMKIITGYGNGGEMNTAMERGEVNGRGSYYSGFSSVRPEWIRDNKIRFLIAVGPPVPQVPGLPNVRQFVKPGSVEAKLVSLIDLNFIVGQAFYAPPGVPAERLAVLRKAFADMLADPALKQDYEKRQLDFEPKSAAEVEEAIAEGFKSAEPAVIERMRAVMGVGKS